MATTLVRREFLQLLGGVGLGAAAVACGTGASESGGSSDSMRLFTYAGQDEYKRLQDVLKQYSSEHDIKVTPENLPGSGAALYPDKLRTQLIGGRPPDVFRNWGGQLAAPFVEATQVANLDSYYKEYGWSKQLLSGAVSDVTVDGHKYGVPIKATAVGFWYRKDHFDAAGIAQPPASYDELEDACRKLRSSGVVPIATGGKYGWHPMRLFEYLLEVSAGPELHDKLMSLEESWEAPEVVQAFELFKSYVDEGWLNDGFLSMSPDDAQNLVTQGKAAMITEVSGLEQELKDSGQDTEGYGTFIPPTDHDPIRFSGFVEQLMVAEASGNKDAAAELIDWLVQPDTISQMKLTGTATIKAQLDPAEYPRTAEWTQALGEYEHYLILDQAFAKELADAYFEVQSAVTLGDKTPDEAATAMQQAIEQWQESSN